MTWGLGYDSTAWVYTGGWGGGHFKVYTYIHTYVNILISCHLHTVTLNLEFAFCFREIPPKLVLIRWKMLDISMYMKIKDGIP